MMMVKIMETGNIENKKTSYLKRIFKISKLQTETKQVYIALKKNLSYNLNTSIPYSLVFLYFLGGLKYCLKVSKYQFILYTLL